MAFYPAYTVAMIDALPLQSFLALLRAIPRRRRLSQADAAIAARIAQYTDDSFKQTIADLLGEG